MTTTASTTNPAAGPDEVPARRDPRALTRLVPGNAPLSLAGMNPMYLLMSLFHASPWLELMGHGWKRKPWLDIAR